MNCVFSSFFTADDYSTTAFAYFCWDYWLLLATPLSQISCSFDTPSRPIVVHSSTTMVRFTATIAALLLAAASTASAQGPDLPAIPADKTTPTAQRLALGEDATGQYPFLF